MRQRLSALQADRTIFDEKLWSGKNASKFDKQQYLYQLSATTTTKSPHLCNKKM